MKIKIIIVDDHTLVSNAIADLIHNSSQYLVTHQVRNGRELLDKLSNPNNIPNIILLDVNMPILNGFETMDELHQNYPNIKVLALSMNEDEQTIIKMIKAGACGYISKIIKEEELLHALENVVDKGFYYTPEVSNIVIGKFQEKQTEVAIQFTEKEKVFLELICSDMTYKEIADKMFLSPKTIDGYRDALFQKFDIKSRIGLVLFAIKNGFYHENKKG